MLWGKKILQWTASPREALAVMIELNNKYALDGRNPNSYSGIFWVLGRYDRPWVPERPIFGDRALHDLGEHRTQGPGQGVPDALLRRGHAVRLSAAQPRGPPASSSASSSGLM